MTYSDDYNIRETSVTFNDVADAIDGTLTRNVAGTTSGTNTAYVASPSPAWNQYVNGSFIVITPHVSNAGACTINVSNLGTKDIKRAGEDLGVGVLVATVPTILVYNGVYFEVLLQNIAIPVGTIQSYAGASAPSGWLLCDGAAVLRTTYADLFSLIGEAFGAGDTTTTFNVPDLQRRMPVGKGTSDTIGDSDGLAEGSRGLTHTHSVPAHYHGKGTLNITSSGTHTTSISHGHTASATNDTHSHTFSGETGGTGLTEFPGRANSTAGNQPKAMRSSATGSDNNLFNAHALHAHSFSGTTTTDTHTHTITVNNHTGNSSSNGAHTHASGDFSGSVGNTGGEDGDSAFDSGAGGQPYLIVNYIIRA